MQARFFRRLCASFLAFGGIARWFDRPCFRGCSSRIVSFSFVRAPWGGARWPRGAAQASTSCASSYRAPSRSCPKRLGSNPWFHRQVVIGRDIVDFVAPAARLIVEVDGAYHSLRRSADGRRDRELSRRGYRILRLDAGRVLEQPSKSSLSSSRLSSRRCSQRGRRFGSCLVHWFTCSRGPRGHPRTRNESHARPGRQATSGGGIRSLRRGIRTLGDHRRIPAARTMPI
jgi:very-short-patch-repair endonuclease